MTQTTNRFLDEFAKLMTDAAGAADGLRKEAETFFKAQGEKVLRDMDVVRREEFEAVVTNAVAAERPHSIRSGFPGGALGIVIHEILASSPGGSASTIESP